MFLSCSVHLTQSHIQMSYESFGSLLNEAAQCDLEALLSSRPPNTSQRSHLPTQFEMSNRATTISTPFVSCSNRAIRRITDPALMRSAFSFGFLSVNMLFPTHRIVGSAVTTSKMESLSISANNLVHSWSRAASAPHTLGTATGSTRETTDAWQRFLECR